MRSGYRLAAALLGVLVMTGTAHAQNGGWSEVAVSAGRVDFDLSGTGHAPAFAVRATRDVFSNVRLEVGGTFSQPDQQFGRSTLFAPEAQVQYRWNAGRLTPYVGGGLGAALVRTDLFNHWDPTVSVAAGSGVRLTERLGLRGEFRLRGHEWNFVGTTSEITAGVVWLLPRL